MKRAVRDSSPAPSCSRSRSRPTAWPRGGLLVALVLPLLACAPARESATVSLRLRGGPEQASVTVDDIPVGSLAVVRERGVALPRGVHHVTVVAPGYLPFDRRVEAESAPVLIDVTMVEVPD